MSDGNIYTRIGVQPFINLTATYTINGGTLMLPEVRAAMDEAARYSVSIDELMAKVGARIARLLASEAAMVTSGCAAALAHATAACVTGGDPERIQQLPVITGPRREVIIPRQSRNMYDQAIRMVGVRLVTVDTREEFAAALGERTAMVTVLGVGEPEGKMRLEEIVAAAHRAGVPVLVDAAAEIPWTPNPYLSRGADLVAYSGGKILRGPQSAGLLLGSAVLIRAAWTASSPHHSFGRPMKAGKEEIMGMLAAVEAFAGTRRIDAEYRTWEGWLGAIRECLLRVPGVEAKLLPPAGASPFPVLAVSWDAARIPITAGELGKRLLDGDPRIMSHAAGPGSSFVVRPAAMEPGQHEAVAARLVALFEEAARPRPPERLAPPAADLSGAWDVLLHFPAGDARHHFDLAAAAGRITGTHRTPTLSGALQGVMDGDRIRVASELPCEGVVLTYHFAGRLVDGGMAGEVDMGEYGSTGWTACRAAGPG